MFSSRFMLFPTLKKIKNSCKKKIPHFTFYAIFNITKIYIEKCPLLVKWEVVSPNSRWGQLESISIISSIPDFVSQIWCGLGGGGGCNVFLTFYAISNISRKKIWEYKPIISDLMFSSCFFCMLQNIKVPLHLQLLVKWEVVSPNSRYRTFYHEIGNIEKCPFTYWLNGGGGFSKS